MAVRKRTSAAGSDRQRIMRQVLPALPLLCSAGPTCSITCLLGSSTRYCALKCLAPVCLRVQGSLAPCLAI